MSATTPANPPLCIRMFGPMEVRIGGGALPPLRSRTGLWLLALLVLRHGRDVQRHWLAGTLWPDSLEEQALYNLRRALSDLRNAMGDQASRILTPAPRSLRLDLSGADVDLVQFDSLVGSSDRMEMERAVALSARPLLEGCVEEWALQERRVREDACGVALDHLAEAARAAGDSPSAVRYLKRSAELDLYDEARHCALMEALAEAADAGGLIHCYRELRLRLHEELQTAPAAQTTALFERLRQQLHERAGRKEAMRSTASSPASTPSSADGETAGGPVIQAARSTLPYQSTSFIGRRDEIAEVKRLLEAHRMVTLTGAGGAGKTRLAMEVAEQLRDQFEHGVCAVELSALSNGALVPHTVAAAFRIQEEHNQSLSDTLASRLARTSALIVLDNCEHLVAECADISALLLASCARIRILATSRERLNISEEVAWRVPSLKLPDPPGPGEEISSLEQYDALRLFAERSAAQRPGLVLKGETLAAAAQLCRRLDGLPLAIELAAAWLPFLSVEQINGRMDDMLRLLDRGSRTAPTRHRTLQATMSWSYDLLGEPERALLRRLAVFVGGWTLEGAEAVAVESRPVPAPDSESSAGTRAIEREDVLSLVAGLVDKSLVLAEPDTRAGARYRMLEPVRQYSLARLAQAGELEALRERHATFYSTLAEAAAPHLTGPRQAEMLSTLEAEHDNLRAALDHWLRQQPEGEATKPASPNSLAGLRLAAALWRYWYDRGHITEGLAYLRKALSLTSNTSPSCDRCAAMHGAGDLAWAQGDYSAAQNSYQQALDVSKLLGIEQSSSLLLNNMGVVAWSRGELSEGRRLFDESLRLGRAAGDPRATAFALTNLSLVACAQAQYAAARSASDEAVLLFRQLRDRKGLAWALDHRTAIALCEEEISLCTALQKESLGISRELADMSGIADSLYLQARIAGLQGEYTIAASYLRQSLAIGRQLGDRRGMAYALAEQGRIAHLSGQCETARRSLDQALETFEALEDRKGIALTLMNRATAACDVGDLDLAYASSAGCLAVYREMEAAEGAAWAHRIAAEAALVRGGHGVSLAGCQEALSTFRTLGHPSGPAWCLLTLARIALAAGEPLTACARMRECLEPPVRGPDLLMRALETSARIARAVERSDPAAVLLGAAAGIRQALGVPPQPAQREELEQCAARLLDSFGEEAYQTARARGALLSKEEALDLARAAVAGD